MQEVLTASGRGRGQTSRYGSGGRPTWTRSRGCCDERALPHTEPGQPPTPRRQPRSPDGGKPTAGSGAGTQQRVGPRIPPRRWWPARRGSTAAPRAAPLPTGRGRLPCGIGGHDRNLRPGAVARQGRSRRLVRSARNVQAAVHGRCFHAMIRGQAGADLVRPHWLAASRRGIGPRAAPAAPEPHARRPTAPALAG